VPVHSDLIRSGFLRFVEHQKTLGHERLFSDLKPDKYERLTAKWGEWFSRYRRECGISHKGLVFHSFRHTFKHWARHVGIIEGVQRQIMGHSAKDVADGYGDGYSLHQVVEGMRLYRVPGFKPPIHPVFGQPEAEI
jgi:integrase